MAWINIQAVSHRTLDGPCPKPQDPPRENPVAATSVDYEAPCTSSVDRNQRGEQNRSLT